MLAPDELLTHVILPAPGAFKSGHYEVRYKESHDWPIAFATVLLTYKWRHRTVGPSRVGCRRAYSVAIARSRAGARRQGNQNQ